MERGEAPVEANSQEQLKQETDGTEIQRGSVWVFSSDVVHDTFFKSLDEKIYEICEKETNFYGNGFVKIYDCGTLKERK